MRCSSSACASLIPWLMPRRRAQRRLVRRCCSQASGIAGALALRLACFAVAVAIVEPFFVGAGFAMYLNRRVELEAWDIEQEFRLAFAR